MRREFDGDDGFSALGGGGEPGELDEAIVIEAEEAAVVRMALAFEVGFEKEGGVDFGFHDDGARGGEPAVELLGPGAVESLRGSEHGALDGDVERF